MAIDTSALLALLEGEPERHRFNNTLAAASVRRLSAASYVEASIVVHARRGRAALHDLMVYVTRAGMEIVAVGPDQAEVAVEAYVRFGKGHHPAGLNYGDLFAYALARTTDDSLLYKGEDFGRTDVLPALLSDGKG